MKQKDWRKVYPLGSLLVNAIQTILELFVYSGVVFYFWNFVMPKLGLPTLPTYWYAVGLFILSRFLLNDHLIAKDPIIVHCDCVEEAETETEMVVENKK